MLQEKDIELELLNKAFSTFTLASDKLSSSYYALEERVRGLNRELERKNRELEKNAERIKKLEEQASRRDRLIAMGEMAAKIAHEVRNPLGSMQLFTSILKKDLTDSSHLDIVDHISAGINTLDTVISNLLIFTKSPKINKQSFNLVECLEELTAFMMKILVQQGISLKKHYDEKIVEVYGDRELIKQVFLNLLLNAMQSMPEGGNLIVATGRWAHNRKDYSGIAISVSDTGTGIKTIDKKRIFDPFFTTKDSGTGLGLTIANNIITDHQGSIDAYNNKEVGATFLITLPKKQLLLKDVA